MIEQEQIQRLSEDNSYLKTVVWELKGQINNKGIHLQLEVERDRIKKKNTQIAQMAEEITALKEKIVELNKRILECGTGEPGKTGGWVAQKKHMEEVEKRKELEKEVKELYKKLGNVK